MRKVVMIAVMLALTGAMAVVAGGRPEAPAPEAPAAPDVYCHPGELDPRYCDRTGNMVADPPVDQSEWLDPGTLIFTYAPTEDPAVYADVYADFIKHLEKELGRPVRWYGVRSYAAQIEAMRAGRLHISGFATGAVQDAVNTAGFVPMVVWGNEDGYTGYRMAIITHVDSDIHTIEDLRGREVAFVSETSNSGYFAPRAILYEEFGMLPGKDYLTAFSGAHDNSILGVLHGDYDSAAIADSILLRMVTAGRVPGYDWIRFIYESAHFPTTAFGVDHRLPPDLQAKIKEAFLNFDWEGTSMAKQYTNEDRWLGIDYQRDWEILRMIRRGSQAVSKLLGE